MTIKSKKSCELQLFLFAICDLRFAIEETPKIDNRKFKGSFFLHIIREN